MAAEKETLAVKDTFVFFLNVADRVVASLAKLETVGFSFNFSLHSDYRYFAKGHEK